MQRRNVALNFINNNEKLGRYLGTYTSWYWCVNQLTVRGYHDVKTSCSFLATL